MEPAGWAALGTALIAMFGAIAVALIQRQRHKPRAWNGQERRTMEAIANAAATSATDKHALTCPMRAEIMALRTEMGNQFSAMRESISKDLNDMRTFIINLHGKP